RQLPSFPTRRSSDLAVFGALVAIMLRGLTQDVYFQIGLLTLVGLSAKNAILIVEFCTALRGEGKPLREAAVEAARLRFRPIIMTDRKSTRLNSSHVK